MRPHISLDVTDLHASVAFYRRVFGVEPQKQATDYAKFDLIEPPLNFSMLSGSPTISRVNHFGIEVESPEAVEDWRRRLERHGLVTKIEQAVECCYAKQDKVWFTDPDGNQWEVFTVLEQLPLSEPSQKGLCCAPTCCAD